MAIIIAFFCGMCFLTLADSIADYISAAAQRLETQAESLKVDAKLRELQAEKGEYFDTSK